MKLANRIFQTLTWVLVACALSVSAHALVRPETRVGGGAGFSSVFASPSASQVAPAHQENPGCAYDFASGVHKYLYCHDDPVNRVDPSGHFSLIEQLSVTTIGTKIALFTTASAMVGIHVYNRFFDGDAANPQERSKIDRGIELIDTAGFNVEADRARELQIRTKDLDDYGQSKFLVFRTILLDKKIFALDDRVFAALLLHETVHSRQYFTRNFLGEPEAYQAESEFLRQVGISGKVSEVSPRLPGAHEYLVDKLENFRKYKVQNPAIVQ